MTRFTAAAASLAASIVLAGCGSIKLNAIADKVCGPQGAGAAEMPAPLGAGLARAKAHAALLASARGRAGAQALAMPDSASASDSHATQGLKLLRGDAIGGVAMAPEAGPHHVPWIGELKDAKKVPTASEQEVPKAREQIRRMMQLKALTREQQVTLDLRSDLVFLRGVEGTLLRGGYDALTLESYKHMVSAMSAGAHEMADHVQEASREHEIARFMSTYFRAYFRGGDAFQVSLNTGDVSAKLGAEAVKSLEGVSNLTISAAQKKALSDAIGKELVNICRSGGTGSDACLLTKALGGEAFITRAGMSVQFAGVGVTLGDGGNLRPKVTYPKGDELGPQVARVMTEALFDAFHPRVPASANSTACTQKLFDAQHCLAASPSGAADETILHRMKFLDAQANRAEALVTTGSGKLIRGASIAALNNEAVAKSLETLAGVVSRKAVEKAGWKLILQNCPPVHSQLAVSVEN